MSKKLQHLAWRAHTLLGALDVSRTDIRLDEKNNPRLMEINTLPGLTIDYSDLCLQAKAYGIAYSDLILEILYLGASAGVSWSRASFHRICKKSVDPGRKFRMHKYVIMGVQGCGKGTQAKMLKEHLDLVHISVGDIFRWNIQSRTKLGARVKRLIAEGES